jgi:hypothetical protein
MKSEVEHGASARHQPEVAREQRVTEVLLDKLQHRPALVEATIEGFEDRDVERSKGGHVDCLGLDVARGGLARHGHRHVDGQRLLGVGVGEGSACIGQLPPAVLSRDQPSFDQVVSRPAEAILGLEVVELAVVELASE